MQSERGRDHMMVLAIAALIGINAFLYFLWRGQTFVHIDAIAHVNKARGLFDNFELGLRNLGTVWLPLPHLLAAPFAALDPLWRNGAAGSLISLGSFAGTSVFLYLTAYRWLDSRLAGWLAALVFLLNPRLIYFFTTPENEPLMVFCAAGLGYFLLRWAERERWPDLALAVLMTLGATLTRYEGWALAAAGCVVIAIVTKGRRFAATILYTGGACLGPMLWMLFNMIYFDDPLMFTYGIGSAQANDTGKLFGTTGSITASATRYFVDVAYCLQGWVLWASLFGVALALFWMLRRSWRSNFVMLSVCGAMFSFYVLNLYTANISILLPGVVPDDMQSMYNVRYGTVMAATVPLFAAAAFYWVWLQTQRWRLASLLALAPFVLPNPIPAPSRETLAEQFKANLFYTEAVHNQSFWMPPFVEIAKKVGDDGLIMTNTRIVHVVVWTTGIPMRRFVTEMNDLTWGLSFNNIDPRINWAITEEGDQLWHGRGKWFKENWIEVASEKGAVTGTVHLFRRPPEKSE